jgi:hypothetical protein
VATNLSLDSRLIEQAVTRTLEEYIARRNQKHLLDLLGKLEWDESFDN